MPDKFERLIKLVYKHWKRDKRVPAEGGHPDEEDIACFLENRLSFAENKQMKKHFINCQDCTEKVALHMKLETAENQNLPDKLVKRVKDLIKEETRAPSLEIILRFKEKFLEVLGTTGDVLVGQELIPAPILRSRKIKDFQDEVTILKDFKDIRVEAKIENKGGSVFSLSLIVKEKSTQKVMKDLRVTLIKDDVELESYLSGTGGVTFEHVLAGKYTLEISNIENKLASVLLDIRV